MLDRCERVLEDHARPVLSLAVAGSKLFSGSYDYTIKVWCLDTLTRLKNLTGAVFDAQPAPSFSCCESLVLVQGLWQALQHMLAPAQQLHSAAMKAAARAVVHQGSRLQGPGAGRISPCMLGT